MRSVVATISTSATELPTLFYKRLRFRYKICIKYMPVEPTELYILCSGCKAITCPGCGCREKIAPDKVNTGSHSNLGKVNFNIRALLVTWTYIPNQPRLIYLLQIYWFIKALSIVGVCDYQNMWYHDYCRLSLRKYHDSLIKWRPWPSVWGELRCSAANKTMLLLQVLNKKQDL